MYRSREASVVNRYSGVGGGDGWVQPSSSRLVEDSEGDLATGALNAFAESHSASSFDVTIDTGEALVRGAYLARDTTTTVTLASSTNNQDVYVGWKDGQSDTVIIGKSGDFSSNDPKIKIWTFDTDGSGVTSSTDQRTLDVPPQGGIKFVQSSEPTVTSGANWLDTDNGVYYAGADLGSGLDWHPIPSVKIREQASTFTESDVTVTHTDTQVNSGSIELKDTGPLTVDSTDEIIEDWEDGDLNTKSANYDGWTGDTGSLTNQTGTVLEGSDTGELNSNNSNKIVEATRGSDVKTDVRFKVQVDNTSNTSPDLIRIRLTTTGGTIIGEIKFNDGSSEINFEGSSSTTTILSVFNANDTYEVIVNLDYNNDEADVRVIGPSNDNTVNNLAYQNSVSGFGNFEVKNQTTGSGMNRNLYFDPIEEVTASADVPTSGNALVEWSSGNPADIQSWLDAGYQVSLDGETVTIDIEDGQGNVLESDIGQGYPLDTDPDVSDADNIKLRANLSRSNTSNNPTCDYLYRRFTR